VPVLNANKQLLGVIQVINKVDGEFSIQDLWILKGFASQTSIAIENAKLFDEINGMKNYLNDLIQNLNSGIITVDKDGIIKTVNRSFCEMLDIEPDEFLGKHYKKTGKKYTSIFQSNERVFRTGEKYEEFDIVTPIDDKKRLIINVNSLPMQDPSGGNIGAVSVLEDVTKEKRIRDNLSRYLPNHLIKEIMNKDGLSLLTGRSQNCSILFSDIRSFTSLTEQLGASEIVTMLNEYFNVMVDAVFYYNGILDKYIGDSIMAVFGIPYVDEDDPINAICAALDMFTRLKKLNQKRVSEQRTPLKIGVGISTGLVVSGNIGSEKRFEYTVIGDPVNLAARLEGATKKYGVDILICENTYKQIQEEFYCREIDTIMVKGKQEATKIYSVIGSKNQSLNNTESEFLDIYCRALTHYRAQQFELAMAAFQLAHDLDREDKPTQLFLQRCQHFQIEPPVEGWDGVWHLLEK
ncbi:MAG: adenylate/guanylate cyclase domain-containing protein, partial [Bacteroidota bacterium]